MNQGDRFGKYEIDRLIARGGMGEVWCAVARGVRGFQKRVVLKTILPHLAEDPEFVRMFVNEALLAARLNHPNVVQIFDLGAIDGRYFIAMEYVPGRTLRQIVRACRLVGESAPLWVIFRVLASVCEGLQYAHDYCDETGKALSLVHRDITPENIMVSFTGAVKILDFGVAKATAAASLTKAGTLKGKYAYISPEQVRGQQPDRRCDIYAVGVILYELLTGKRPFWGETDLQLLQAVAAGNPTPPRQLATDMPEEVEAIILHSLERDVSKRYPEASGLAEELLAFLRTIDDVHPQRDLGLFVSSLFPDEPSIPSDVAKRLSSTPSKPSVAQQEKSDPSLVGAIAGDGDSTMTTFKETTPSVLLPEDERGSATWMRQALDSMKPPAGEQKEDVAKKKVVVATPKKEQRATPKEASVKKKAKAAQSAKSGPTSAKPSKQTAPKLAKPNKPTKPARPVKPTKPTKAAEPVKPAAPKLAKPSASARPSAPMLAKPTASAKRSAPTLVRPTAPAKPSPASLKPSAPAKPSVPRPSAPALAKSSASVKPTAPMLAKPSVPAEQSASAKKSSDAEAAVKGNGAKRAVGSSQAQAKTSFEKEATKKPVERASGKRPELAESKNRYSSADSKTMAAVFDRAPKSPGAAFPEPRRKRPPVDDDEDVRTKMHDIWTTWSQRQPDRSKSAAEHCEEGFVAVRRGDYQDAQRSWEAAAELDPESRAFKANLRMIVGLIEAQVRGEAASWPPAGRRLPSETVEKEVPAKEPPPKPRQSNEPPKQAAAHCDAGFTHLRNGEHQLALGEWEAALKLDPENRAYKANLKMLRKAIEKRAAERR